MQLYQLTTSVPYLLNRVGVRMGALFSQKLKPHGLTLPMYRVLASLAERPEQTLTDLAAMTSAELSTMSRMIGVMATNKLVTRKRIENNERTVSIKLTPKGEGLAQQMMLEARHYEEVATSQLDDADVAKLRQSLTQIYNALDLLEAELADSNRKLG